jgi:hypothetical protein
MVNTGDTRRPPPPLAAVAKDSVFAEAAPDEMAVKKLWRKGQADGKSRKAREKANREICL